MDFRQSLISELSVLGMSIMPVDGMEGEALRVRQEDNLGMEQMFSIICKLHEEYKGNAAKPTAIIQQKKSEASTLPKILPPATSATSTTSTTSTPSISVISAATLIAKPKRKYTRKVPVQEKSADSVEDDSNKLKRPPTKYSLFTSCVSTRISKDIHDDWTSYKIDVKNSDIKERLSITDSKQNELVQKAESKENGISKSFTQLNGDCTMEEIYTISYNIVKASEGKVHPFKVAGLMWIACGGVNPFP